MTLFDFIDRRQRLNRYNPSKMKPFYLWGAIAFVFLGSMITNLFTDSRVAILSAQVKALQERAAHANDILVFTNGFKTYQGAFVTNDAECVLVIRERRMP